MAGCLINIRFLCVIMFVGVTISEDNEPPMVCTTPNGETAHCISLYSCPVLLKALGSLQATALEFVRQSQCGFQKDFLVCYGSTSPFTAASTSSYENKTIEVAKGPPVWIWTGSSDQKNSEGLEKKNYLLDNRNCGFQSTQPWVVLLRKQMSDGEKVAVCSGTLISQRYVLTVVECLAENITVVLGQSELEQTVRCSADDYSDCYKGATEVQIEEEYIHPKYDMALKLYNIALVRLSQDIENSNFVKPICLHTENDRSPKEGDEMINVGWTAFEGEATISQKIIKNTILSNKNCPQLYQNLQISDNSFLCIKDVGKEPACSEHVGGPIMYLHDNQWYLEGIVSIRGSCGSDSPNFGIRISGYLDWIFDNISK